MTRIVLMVIIFNITTFSVGQMVRLRPSEYRRLSRMGRAYPPRGNRPLEPNCEELKAMWRFNRRQGRASEITNEAPTFKDPFAYNIWQKYSKMQSSVATPRPMGRVRSEPVYGRVVHTAPSDHPRVMNPEPPKHYGVVRYFEPDEAEQARRNFGLAKTFGPPNRKQKGSFQRLKELVWADRMKDVKDQREPAGPHLVFPLVGNNSPAPVSGQASAPGSAPGSESASVPEPTLSPPPVETRAPPAPPASGGAPVEEEVLPVSGPYESALQGQESSDYINTFSHNRSTRMKVITDILGPRDDDGDEESDEYSEYGTHGRKDMQWDNAPYTGI